MKDEEFEQYMGSMKERCDALRRCGFTVTLSLGEDETAELQVRIRNREIAENSLTMHRRDDYRERQNEGLP